MKKVSLICAQRIYSYQAVPAGNKQDLVYAVVFVNGKHDYSYFLRDSSKEEQVLAFIQKWDKRRHKAFPDEECYGVAVPETWSLVA